MLNPISVEGKKTGGYSICRQSKQTGQSEIVLPLGGSAVENRASIRNAPTFYSK